MQPKINRPQKPYKAQLLHIENITHLIFSILGRRYFGRSFLQLQLQCITQIPTDEIKHRANGTMKKCIIVFTCVSRL